MPLGNVGGSLGRMRFEVVRVGSAAASAGAGAGAGAGVGAAGGGAE
jgi:hypothetical protein